MCGIAGWINFKEDLTSKKNIIELMGERLAHRGPDSSGVWVSPHALFAHRRLAVVDPEGGLQPMIKQYGSYKYVITYNGELYNTPDLRSQLESKGHVFQTNSDTEVLLVSYIEWGTHCVEYLNGIYAFGIWSEKDNSLFMARDRFGVKPLFYTLKGDSFIFASEPKAILIHPYIDAELDSEGLNEIFALGPARTPGHGIFRNLHELKPAQYILHTRQGTQIQRYWALESYQHNDDLETTIEKVGTLVRDSIKRQLVADVPVCTFLSGGLDSSAITAVTALEFQNNLNHQLHTYSIDYVDNDLFFKPNSFQPNSDAPFVKKMSQEYSTYHHYLNYDTPHLVKALRDATIARDFPGMADVDTSLFLFCREIKKNATVALSGECADEVFGGYPWFFREDMLNANTFPWSPSMKERTKLLSEDLVQTLKPEQYAAMRYAETLEEVPRLKGENSIDAKRRELFYLNIVWFMSTLLDRKDRMSMASGLEVRVPYCDHRLVQYVWNIPWDMKTLEGVEKGILRSSLSGLLPDDVLNRRKSPYPKTHNPSYEEAMKNWLLEIVSNNNSPLKPLVDVKKIQTIAGGPSSYGKPWFGQLMATPQMFAYLIQVDIWLREYKVRII